MSKHGQNTQCQGRFGMSQARRKRSRGQCLAHARRGRSTQCGEPVTFYAIYYQSEYNYTGTVQTFTAPVDGWYKVQLWGAAGGDDGDHHGWRQGGKGGYVEAEIKLEAEQKIYVYIGAPGMDNVTATGAGYNGGGNPGTDGYSGSGGGASDIRLIDGEWDNPVGLSTRILVAGGGGGAGLRGDGGYGGGLVGGNGRGDAWNDQYGNNFPGGDGGTQTSAGNRGGFGYGGTNGADGGGGGGGWYGGGARGPCRPSDSGQMTTMSEVEADPLISADMDPYRYVTLIPKQEMSKCQVLMAVL